MFEKTEWRLRIKGDRKLAQVENIDKSEVEKFDALASRWWDENAEFKTLHQINPLRANWIDSITNVAEQSFLDIGCGGGLLSEAMAVRGAKVVGIDMSTSAIEVANLHKLEFGLEIDYKLTSAEELVQNATEKFDIVSCMELLEHIPDPSSLIKATATMLKPGGYAFFSTINRHFWGYLKTVVAAEYILKWVPKGTHHYKDFIKPYELVSWCENNGLEVLEMQGLIYNPVLKEYKLASGRVESNYMLACRKTENL